MATEHLQSWCGIFYVVCSACLEVAKRKSSISATFEVDKKPGKPVPAFLGMYSGLVDHFDLS